MNILDKIVEQKKREVQASKKLKPITALKDSQYFGREKLSLKKSIKDKSGIIAEYKRQSPSKGIINNSVLPIDVVSNYEAFGASGISILTDKEREIVNLYFGIDVSHNYTLEEIAYRLDLTRERVRQIKDKALKKLKQHPNKTLQRMYMEQ